MSDTALDKIHDSIENINNVAFELQRLSSAFYATGNETLSGELAFYSKDLFMNAKDIGNGTSEMINDRLEASKQATSNMINACLAGALTSREREIN